MGGPQHQVGRFSGHRPRDIVDGSLVDGKIEQRAGREYGHGYEGAVEQRQAEADGHTHAPWATEAIRPGAPGPLIRKRPFLCRLKAAGEWDARSARAPARVV